MSNPQIIDILETLEPLPTYEDLVSAALAAREQKDACQWLMGDLAGLLFGPTVSGKPADEDQLLGEFAKDVGCSKSSMSEYKRLAAFYPKFVRANYPNLSYSHFRTAYYAYKELDTALNALEAASAAGLTVDAFGQSTQQNGDDVLSLPISDLVARFPSATVKVRRRDWEERKQFRVTVRIE